MWLEFSLRILETSEVGSLPLLSIFVFKKAQSIYIQRLNRSKYFIVYI